MTGAPVDPLESAMLAGAVRALRRRAEAIRARASVGVTVLDGYQPKVIIIESKAAHLFGLLAISIELPTISKRNAPSRREIGEAKMGARSDIEHAQIISDAFDGPAVSATPGYFRLDQSWPAADPEPVLAWKVGGKVVLPVTAAGYDRDEYYVLYPDGSVRPHFPCFGSAAPVFKSVEEWREDATADMLIAAAKADADGLDLEEDSSKVLQDPVVVDADDFPF